MFQKERPGFNEPQLVCIIFDDLKLINNTSSVASVTVRLKTKFDC